MTKIPLLEKPGRNRPVLLVESDSEALEALRLRVKADGFQVEVVHTASEATKKVLRTPYSAVLVGTDLPDGPGFAVAAELRRVDMRTPILLLAGPGSRDAVFFFQNGETPTSGVTDGDLDLLSERILGLVDGEEPRPSVLVRCPPLEMNRVRREVRCSGVRMSLTQIEFRILEELMLNANRKVAPQDLHQTVWGESQAPSSNVLAVHIRNLRKKLEEMGFETLLETVYGEGYVLRDLADSGNPLGTS